MRPSLERSLLVATPVVAMTAVGLGLGLGARQGPVRAAVIYAAPASEAGTGLAWQVVAFEEGEGGREPMARSSLEVVARSGDHTVRWNGTTTEDGVAEALLPLPAAESVWLDVRASGVVLAQGQARVPPHTNRPPPAPPWMRFARRQGDIVLDVAVLGQRVAPGFPAVLWVRATNALTHAPAAGAKITPEDDPSLAGASVPGPSRTDSRGWAEVVVTPVGLAVSLSLHARTDAGLVGEWIGGLTMSPGGAQVQSRLRWSPEEEPEIDVVAPTARTAAYVEVDDAHGRAWATTLSLVPANSLPAGAARAPRLAPGLYWAVVSADPAGAAELVPGTSARPFFVASSDDQALAFGPDRAECATPRDIREARRALSSCLALAPPMPTPRWTALEGFSTHRAEDRERRKRGLAVALGAIVVAAVLETTLLLRIARNSRLRRHATGDGADALDAPSRAWRIFLGLLLALLGFALLAGFLLRD